MSNTNTTTGWSALAGIVLVAAGLIGFLNTSFAGDGANAFLAVDTIHNVVHVATGLIALYIAFGLRGEQQANAVLGFGILYAIIFVAVLVSPNLFGVFKVSANAPLHVIHAAVAVVSLAIGYMARGGTSATAR